MNFCCSDGALMATLPNFTFFLVKWRKTSLLFQVMNARFGGLYSINLVETFLAENKVAS